MDLKLQQGTNRVSEAPTITLESQWAGITGYLKDNRQAQLQKLHINPRRSRGTLYKHSDKKTCPKSARNKNSGEAQDSTHKAPTPTHLCQRTPTGTNRRRGVLDEALPTRLLPRLLRRLASDLDSALPGPFLDLRVGGGPPCNFMGSYKPGFKCCKSDQSSRNPACEPVCDKPPRNRGAKLLL